MRLTEFYKLRTTLVSQHTRLELCLSDKFETFAEFILEEMGGRLAIEPFMNEVAYNVSKLPKPILINYVNTYPYTIHTCFRELVEQAKKVDANGLCVKYDTLKSKCYEFELKYSQYHYELHLINKVFGTSTEDYSNNLIAEYPEFEHIKEIIRNIPVKSEISATQKTIYLKELGLFNTKEFSRLSATQRENALSVILNCSTSMAKELYLYSNRGYMPKGKRVIFKPNDIESIKDLLI